MSDHHIHPLSKYMKALEKGMKENDDKEALTPAKREPKFLRSSENKLIDIERRRYRRILCEIPISYSLLEGTFPVSGKSTTVNMSPSGVMFPVDQVIAKGRLLRLAIALPIHRAIKVTGKVRWTSKIEDRSYHLGVQFLRYRNEDTKRIADYIYK